MLTCPYHNPGKCRYPLPCNLEMAMPQDGVFEYLKKMAKKSWDLCLYRGRDDVNGE